MGGRWPPERTERGLQQGLFGEGVRAAFAQEQLAVGVGRHRQQRPLVRVRRREAHGA